MIAKLAFSFVTSTYGRYIILALAVLVAISGFGKRRENKGRELEREEILDDVRTSTEKGRDAFHENQRNFDGGGVDAAIDRLRGRDDHWGRMPDLR